MTFLPTGSQLKKAGEKDREAAVNNLKPAGPKRQSMLKLSKEGVTSNQTVAAWVSNRAVRK